MTSKNELHAIERDLYQLFDMVWAKFYAQIKDKPLFDKTEVDLTEAESFVLDKGPKWLQNIGYYRDLVGSQQLDSCLFKRMKQDLNEWIEKDNVRSIRIDIHWEPDGRRGVKFTDMTNAGHKRLIIIGWPTIGLVDGAIYKPEELLITGEAGEE